LWFLSFLLFFISKLLTKIIKLYFIDQ